MPTYEYRCMACGHQFERLQNISESPVKTCPECKKRRVERLISKGGGIVFKGPGFYATDYRKDGPPKKAESESSSKGSSKVETPAEPGDAKGKS